MIKKLFLFDKSKNLQISRFTMEACTKVVDILQKERLIWEGRLNWRCARSTLLYNKKKKRKSM